MMKAHENPFAIQTLERVLSFDPSLINETWESIEQRWRKLNYRAAIVGHHGSGKTTFLESFSKQLENCFTVHYLFLNDQKRHLAPEDVKLLEKSNKAFYFIDGEEYLSFFEQKKLYKKLHSAKGFITALHKPNKTPILLECKADASLAEKLLQKLPLENQEMIKTQLPSLLKKHNNNLREVWMDCYDFL